MFESPFLLIDKNGIVTEANVEATLLCGIPRDELVSKDLADRILPEHQLRFKGELEALLAGEEKHGRVYCTLMGLDGIGRRLLMRMVPSGESDVLATLAPDRASVHTATTGGSSLLEQGRLLPVARRITAIARRASSKGELLRRGLEVMAEVTSSTTAGAAMEWESSKFNLRVVAEVGSFDRNCIAGMLRPAVVARLTRGDVVVKEPDDDGKAAGSTLVIVPLLSHTAPVGVITLFIEGHSVLVPEEQQSLAILGEIIGLGLKGLDTVAEQEKTGSKHRGDAEANVALGRLSAGLAHEINNAATILRSNIEQMILRRSTNFRDGSFTTSIFRDSITAIEEIRDLTDALHAFAPEETRALEDIDPLRVLEMVVRSVRFHAKRGLGVHFAPPDEEIGQVKVRSHHLIRSLFLVFEELMETGLDAGNEIDVALWLEQTDGEETMIKMDVTTAPVGLPSVLLSQLEKGGAIARHLNRAGASLSHTFDESGKLTILILMPSASMKRRASQPVFPSSPSRRGTILIADDEAAVIRSLRRLLESDHDVLAAQSGREALALIRSNQQIDIVLCDVFLAHLDGIQLYEELKRMGHPLSDKLVFITGGSLGNEVTSFLESTSNYVLEKPLDTAILKDTLAALLS